MRGLIMAGLFLILAACGSTAQPAATIVVATATQLPTATATVAWASCRMALGLSVFPQGTLATISAIDGWSTGHWQMAVNIEGTLVLSGTSRVYILDTMTETLRVSIGQTSSENLQRLQSLIESPEFATLDTC
jgi:hypothetical protein